MPPLLLAFVWTEKNVDLEEQPVEICYLSFDSIS
jgi:hypothetical protein